MPKEKETRKEKPDLEHKIETTLDLEVLTLKGGAWHLRIIIPEILKSTFLRYKVALEFDAAPFERRMAQVQKQLDSGLFKNDPAQKESAKQEIEGIKSEMQELVEQCEPIDFISTTEALKYVPKGLRIELAVPDKVVDAFNRQKERLHHYKATLIPLV